MYFTNKKAGVTLQHAGYAPYTLNTGEILVHLIGPLERTYGSLKPRLVLFLLTIEAYLVADPVLARVTHSVYHRGIPAPDSIRRGSPKLHQPVQTFF